MRNEYIEYPNYKLSQQECIETIPIHWVEGKLRFYTEVKDGTHDTPPFVEEADDSYPMITSKDLFSGELDFSNCKYISIVDHKSIFKRSNVLKNDIIMPMIGSVGSPVIVGTDKEFSIKNIALFKTSFNSRLIPKFLYYTLFSNFITQQFKLDSRGGVQNFVSLSILRNLKILYPPHTEQIQIASFLDKKTAQIDKLINEKEKLLKLLAEKRTAIITRAVTKGLDPNVEMKDSGIEWLGEIPKSWNSIPFKRVLKFVTQGPNPDYKYPTNNESSYRVLKTKNLYNDAILYNTCDPIAKETFDPLEKLELRDGDMLMSIVGKGSIGKVNIFRQQDRRYIFTRAIAILRFYNKSLSRFYHFYFLSQTGNKMIESIIDGSTGQEVVKTSNIRLLNVPMPSEKDATDIVNYLEKEIEKYKKIESQIKTSINQLKEYREALITAAVTGQIKVSNCDDGD